MPLAELRFSQICEKTIRRAIEDAKMEEAKRRLKGGATANEIVKSLRFTSANQFYRIYKRHFGHTIRQANA
jgi:AraC-like DNA-binding protein